ncbi:MAG: flagellar biosynthesis protein FlhF [Planctomycetia bacterium]|nr:flagellar biosynthesis protein FlhF [Planctomycetia bacterium]
MELRTYSARSIQEALQLVRRDLGPDAAVLHTREVRDRRMFGLLPGTRRIEITASRDVNVPSRFDGGNRRRTEIEDARDLAAAEESTTQSDTFSPSEIDPAPQSSVNDWSDLNHDEIASEPMADGTESFYSPLLADLPLDEESESSVIGDSFTAPSMPAGIDLDGHLAEELAGLRSLVDELRRNSHRGMQHDLPDALFGLFTDLIEADFSEDFAQQLLAEVRREMTDSELADPRNSRRCVLALIEARIGTSGPIEVAAGKRRLVALVGPTGVGKTTTIAKLAANFRLREKRKVGLITVDTYRIAAVDQLRTYADIIDLPMEVISTPREVGPALERLRDQELILMDTAGRSPQDAVRIQELKAVLAAAAVDEVHLVLGSVTSATQLRRTAEQFAEVGTTSVILTKLDEAVALGNLLPLLTHSKLPVSYLTDGQNVPDDIEAASAATLARRILRWQEATD